MTNEEIIAFYLDATRDLLTIEEVRELALLCITRAKAELIKELMKNVDP